MGDILSFYGGQADATKYACITSNSIKIGGRQSIKCVGKNQKLSQAKSKNDKNISGLLARIEAGKIGIHTFTNASAFMVADVDTKIISIEFATTGANHAQFFGQVIVDVTAQPVTRCLRECGLRKQELFLYAAAAEKLSEHSLGKAIVRCYEKDVPVVSEFKMEPGEGVSAKLEGKLISVGNEKILTRIDISVPEIIALWLSANADSCRVIFD